MCLPAIILVISPSEVDELATLLLGMVKASPRVRRLPSVAVSSTSSRASLLMGGMRKDIHDTKTTAVELMKRFVMM